MSLPSDTPQGIADTLGYLQHYLQELMERQDVSESNINSTLAALTVTNFIQPYFHQFFIDSHGLNCYGKPLKNLLIDTSHVLRKSIMAEILGRSTGNHYGTIY